MKRRMLAALIACLMTFSMLGISAGAAEVTPFALEDPPSGPITSMWEDENNDNAFIADPMSSHQHVYGTIPETTDQDFFAAVVEKPGFFHAECRSKSSTLRVILYPGDGPYLGEAYSVGYDASEDVYKYVLNFYLVTPGTYYLRIADEVNTGDYDFYYSYRPYIDKYVDVSRDDYFYIAVQWADTEKITSGIDDTHFGPYVSCTREQMVFFLWKYFQSPEPNRYSSHFKDVNPGAYYYKAINWAVESRITSGLDYDTFGVGSPCTRAQMMTFLWTAFDRRTPSSFNTSFTDIRSTDYYYQAVLWAVENGITKGVDAHTFGPGVECTRAHAVTFLYNSPLPPVG